MKTNNFYINLLKQGLALGLLCFVLSVQAQEINNNGIDDDGDCNIDCEDLDFGTRTVQYSNGMDASFVVGQTDFVTNTPGVGPASLDRPYDVAVDPTTGKVFVSDLNNHRVIRYATFDDFIHNANAEAVIGQIDLNANSSGVSSTKLYQPTGIFVDDTGTLWVADWGNNRVLRFDDASSLSNLPPADGVLGQSNFTSFGNALTRNGMSVPVDVIVDNGTLWVADQGNGRVLRFNNAKSKANGANADGVLGAPDYWDNSGTASPWNINSANGLAMICNSLYVSDGSSHRVVRWDNPSALSNGANASVVLGQPDFYSTAFNTSQNGMFMPRLLSADSKNNLFVNDASNNRILIFNEAGEKGIGANADIVLGQPNFFSSIPGTTINTLNSPRGVAIIESGNRSYTAVAEALGNRITIFGHPDLSTNEQTAISDVLPGYDPAGSGGLTFSILNQPSSGIVVVDNTSTGAYTYTPGGLCPYDEDHIESFTYQVTNNYGCSATGEVAIKVTNVGACVEIPFNGIDDDDDCNIDCDDMSFGVRINDFRNGMTSSHLMGQSTYFNTSAGLGSNAYNHPYDVALDPISRKVFVSDSHNHRILRFATMESFIYGDSPEAVFGQADFVSNISGTTATTFRYPTGIYVDNAGILWVSDWGNRRVLRFDSAADSGNGVAASGVLGQPNFTTLNAQLTINGMGAVTDVVVDDSGTLYVAEEGNGRVIRFDNASGKLNGANADGVLGAPDFTSNPAIVDDSNISVALGITIICNSLYVSDGDNHRVLRWDNPSGLANGAPADVVLGQVNFTSGSPSLASFRFNTPRLLNGDAYNNLYVGDEMNHRILIFNEVENKSNGAMADKVIGQPNLLTGSNGIGDSKFNRPKGATILEDGLKSYMVVSDEFNNRIMGFGGGFRNTSETAFLNGDLSGYDPSGSGGLNFTSLTDISYGTIGILNNSTGQFVMTPGDECVHEDDFFTSFTYEVSNANGCSQRGEMVVKVTDTGPCLEDCNNGIDDDNNGFIDLEDPMCDKDGDGVINMSDIDWDNDGINNLKEEAAGIGMCSGYSIRSVFKDSFGTGLRSSSDYVNLCYENNTDVGCSPLFNSGTYSNAVDKGEYALVKNSDDANQGAQNWISVTDLNGDPNGRFLVVNPTSANEIVYERSINAITPGVSVQLSVLAINLFKLGSGKDIPRIALKILDANGIVLKSQEFNLNEDESWKTLSTGGLFQAPTPYVVQIVNVNDGDGNDFIVDAIQLDLLYKDCDGDGVWNVIDLDSDNDGITDIKEQNGADADGNGILDNISGTGLLLNDGDNNGADDAHEGQVIIDTDGDNALDIHDLDSDNDGLYDVLEAGGIDPDFNGVIGSGVFSDPNGNGLSVIIDPSEAGIAISVKDSDADGSMDAKELDSDNDGCSDVMEAGFPDGDSNGLLGTGTVGSGLNVNGNGVVTP